MLSNTIHYIRKILDSNIASSEETLEIEAKFGYYTKRGFVSSVPYVHFDRLIKRLTENPSIRVEETQHSEIAQMGTIRRITTTPKGNDPETVLWQRKQNIQNFDVKEYEMRVSINTEKSLSLDEIPTDFVPTTIRIRTRKSFYMQGDTIKI